jgi:hypothetical protein
MPRKDDAHFNEFAFKNSLEATIDKEKIENLYEKGSIGFLAAEENLEDEEFVNYIKELMARFPEVRFKGFVFNEKQKTELEKIFSVSICSCIVIKSVTHFLASLEVYIGALNMDLEWNLIKLCRRYSNYVITPKLKIQDKPILELIDNFLTDTEYKLKHIKILKEV